MIPDAGGLGFGLSGEGRARRYRHQSQQTGPSCRHLWSEPATSSRVRMKYSNRSNGLPRHASAVDRREATRSPTHRPKELLVGTEASMLGVVVLRGFPRLPRTGTSPRHESTHHSLAPPAFRTQRRCCSRRFIVGRAKRACQEGGGVVDGVTPRSTATLKRQQHPGGGRGPKNSGRQDHLELSTVHSPEGE